jgi:hypothetical protein
MILIITVQSNIGSVSFLANVSIRSWASRQQFRNLAKAMPLLLSLNGVVRKYFDIYIYTIIDSRLLHFFTEVNNH